jgi:hypothetical protein
MRYFAQMKRLLVFVFAVGLLAPLQASAHQPVSLLPSDTSAVKGPLLVDGTVSFAIRASFSKAKEKRGFRANLKSGDSLEIQYLIVDRKPESTLRASRLPSLVVTSPTGKRFTMKLNERTKFFEPYGGTNYLYLGRYSAAAEAGTYSFLLTSRTRSAVTIAVGDREVPGEVQRGVATVVSPSTPAAPAVVSYTLSQVASNNRSASCWSIIDGSVYNLTNWIASHPGGSSAITSLCGVDGTASFKAKHGSQSNPAQRLSMYLLGPLAK